MEKKYFSVDRFESDFAVIEDDDERTFNVLISKLPIGTSEGDVLFLLDGQYLFDKEETQKRREYLLAKLRKIEKNNSI